MMWVVGARGPVMCSAVAACRCAISTTSRVGETNC